MKIKNNECPSCQSNNVFDDDGQIIRTDCGSVLGYQFVTSYSQKQNYDKYVNNIYKRKTYVKILIKQKLNDLTCNIKERIK